MGAVATSARILLSGQMNVASNVFNSAVVILIIMLVYSVDQRFLIAGHINEIVRSGQTAVLGH